jgi:hypothetical protein
MTPTEELRNRLLKRCDEIYAQERWKNRGSVRPDPSKLIGEGIRAGRSAIEETPLQDDRTRYLTDIKERVQQVQAKVRTMPVSEDGYDDEDGYILGGISTVLREVEQEEGRSRSGGPGTTPPSEKSKGCALLVLSLLLVLAAAIAAVW